MTLIALSMAWILGFTAVAAWGAPWWMAGLWIAVASPAAWRWRGREAVLLALACAVVAFGGGVRFETWQSRDEPSLAALTGQTVEIEGVVDSVPSPGLTTTTYTVRAKGARVGDARENVDGGVRVTTHQYAEWLPGDRVLLSGELVEPPVFETFDYRAYLARREIVGSMLFPTVEEMEGHGGGLERQIGRARLELQEAIERALPEPEASLGAGIVLGLDGGMSRELEEQFRDAGLSHIVAVSGSNIALVTAIAFALLVPLVGRTAATYPAAAMIVVYTLLAGGDGPVIRAGIMAAIMLAGWLLGRQQSGAAALAAAVIVMTAFSPGIALDAGFQLSVAATAGIMIFGPWIRSGLGHLAARVPVPESALSVVTYTLAANVAVLPLLWAHFGQVSLVGLVANLVVAPVFAVAFFATGLAAVAGLVWEPAGWAVGLVAYYPLHIIVLMAEETSGWPGATLSGRAPGATLAIGMMAVLALAAWPAYRYYPPERPLPRAVGGRVTRMVVAGGAAGFAVLAIGATTLSPMDGPGELEVAVLDVGQGDAILVTTPGGQQVLVDGGPGGLGLVRELGEVMPHWDRRIDAVVLTHGDGDHIGGLPAVLERFKVGTVYETGAERETFAFEAFRERAGETELVHRGDAFEVDGVTFDVLWPEEGLVGRIDEERGNDLSIVLRVRYGKTSVLLTGDFEATAQRALMGLDDVSAEVLKVPHHGSATTALEFLEAVDPAVAVISVGAENNFGHPRAEIVEALAGSLALRTDENGRVTVVSDGERIEVRTER